jgi:NADH-quinone oxidoreductase subunit N
MPLSSLLVDLSWWAPELALSIGALVVLIVGVFSRQDDGPSRGALAAAWLAVLAAAALLPRNPAPGEAFFGLIWLDSFSYVFRWIALGVVALTLLLARGTRDVAARWSAEYLTLVLLVGVGLMLMAEANHLLMAYLAMELVSLSSYVLAGFLRDARAAEASLKYVLFGALASGLMLFGMSLLYGLTGELSFPAIQQSISAIAESDPARLSSVAATVALLLAGLAFKISVVPFHMWTPDVYEGAPIPVTAMLSVGPKAAGLALLLRMAGALAPLWGVLTPVLLALTVVTMTFGNLVGLVQSNVKRLLAYSTIGQVGYLMIGVMVNTTAGVQAMVLYLVAYLFMNLGAFACVAAVWNASGSESLEAFRGLGRRSPLLAFCLALFLLSLAGMPPLLGFFGKFLLFGSAVEAGMLWLAIVAAVNSAIAVYYYINIIRLMYLHPPVSQEPLRPTLSLRLAVAVCTVAVVALGIFPGGLIAWVARLG